MATQISLLVLAHALAGCLQAHTNTCEDGGVCGPGLRCGTAGDHRLCVVATCGDGVVDADEQCDDGNNVSGDGCPADCRAACGDGLLDPGEQCDDGNVLDSDGCDRNCTRTACGNGFITDGEDCDDGNLIDGDGCDHDCTPTGCGNAIVTAGEACDDGNTRDDDGCQHDCTLTCVAQPLVATIEPSLALDIPAGVPLPITLTVTNRNAPQCPPRQPSFSVDLETNGPRDALTFAPPVFQTTALPDLASGTSERFTWTVTPSVEIAPGTGYSLLIVVRDDPVVIPFLRVELSIGEPATCPSLP